jgi:tRNA(Ile)-lysidine synthase
MDLLISFKQFIKNENLFSVKERLMLAVSGGVDSVVLCELCRQAGYDFAIAHCNFQLRGEESDSDEGFVKALAEKYEVEFFVKKFETEKYATENKTSIQVAARELRYNWFNELLDTIKETSGSEALQSPLRGVGGLLTAHHADDNIETILMNFFKGSGINGLKGILPKQQHIIRPLLFANKEAILSFAKENRLAYREDSSNSSDKYTRNYFRNQLIPGLEKVFPKVKENLLNNAIRFREIHMIYDNAMEQAKHQLLTRQGNEVHIPVLKLLKSKALSSVLYETIKEFGFTAHQTHEAEKLLLSASGKYIESSTHRILRNRKWLIIAPLNEEGSIQFLLKENETAIVFPLGKLTISKADKPGKIEKEAHIAQLDARDIQFPLLLRKWKNGDYFYPLGMPKKKKLSRFFVDLKMSLTEKEKTWVIESNKKIIWVLGKRVDDRFKVKESTTHTIRFELWPAK